MLIADLRPNSNSFNPPIDCGFGLSSFSMGAVAIVNPAAGRARRFQLPIPAEILETTAPGHAIELTRQAIRQGARTIIAVGGDGTINEVVNGFFENEKLISTEAELSIVPRGTGSSNLKFVILDLRWAFVRFPISPFRQVSQIYCYPPEDHSCPQAMSSRARPVVRGAKNPISMLTTAMASAITANITSGP
jgi:hypothetical protein